MGDLFSRFRYPLTYLVLALASLLSIASPDRSARTGIATQLLLEVTGPLNEMVTFPFQQMRALWRNYGGLVGVKEELDTSKKENTQLRQEVLELREALVASERFKRFGDFQARHGRNLLPADVSAQDLSAWFKSITIDKGASDGVTPGMAVITDEGVVGVVSAASPSFSRVLLVSDPQSEVQAYVQRSRARGAVRGRSDGLCTLEYVARDADVQVGDPLLTSGIGGIYPRGLLVGSVSAVEREAQELFQRVKVKPAVEFSSLEEVFVVLERHEIPESTEFSTESEDLWAVPSDPAPAGAQPKPAGPPSAPAPTPARPDPAEEAD